MMCLAIECSDCITFQAVHKTADYNAMLTCAIKPQGLQHYILEQVDALMHVEILLMRSAG